MGHEKQKKEKLRQFGIEVLKKIAVSGDKKTKEQKIAAQLFATDYWKNVQVIGLTLSNEFEIDTRPLIEEARATGKIVVIPKTLPKRQMAFYAFTEHTGLKRSNFGVLEPVSTHLYEADMIDLLIVPGIVFHPEGYRIGFGGGYYDRYLQEYPHQTCSLAFKEMIHSDWQPEIFDKKIQHLLID
ncbi:5-formyltetrahydrofolate cyclo-ligase [Candidatus Enterococcus mangumiae]|uniref:5-formyltetrahydrofolate cyclo-ligase n=1 Tax=Candidatus Enterococcus mangumiae TaxID=2230878 RepID=A0ABZ2T061_9ENTE|nr:5-formyltetrahydrofolate cyclo-ligase [Enterococcus sp. DIV1094]MBO0491128.1 5-formyltetrahydrofolate cyclo-ligase [Enterococcus sp. DIV1094]